MAPESLSWIYCKWQRCDRTGTGALRCCCTGEVIHLTSVLVHLLLRQGVLSNIFHKKVLSARDLLLSCDYDYFVGCEFLRCTLFFFFSLFSCCLKWHWHVFWCYTNNLLIPNAHWNTNSLRRWGRIANETAKALLLFFQTIQLAVDTWIWWGVGEGSSSKINIFS